MLPLRDATPLRRPPVVTALLLAACALVYGYELLLLVQDGGPALNRFVMQRGLVPADLVAALQAGDLVSDASLDVLTHMFLHASWLHLLGNALFLWIFAPAVEQRLGRFVFLALYLAGGVAAAAGQVASDPTLDAPMIGASGAISAILGAYLVLFPRARIQSLVFLLFYYELVAVPAVVVLVFWFVLQLIDGFASLGLTAEASGGIAFWAHIGGFAGGVLLALVLRLLRLLRRVAAGPVPSAEPAPAATLAPPPAGPPRDTGPPPSLPPPPPGR